MGDHRESLRCAEEAARVLADLGSPPSPVLLGNISSAHFHLGAMPAAAICGFILRHPSLHGHTRAAMQARDYPAVFERRLSPEAWAAPQGAGAGHSLDSAVEYALSWLRGRSS